jgi:hypothetical protein
MRIFRIAGSRQLALFPGKDEAPGRWDGLPEKARAEVLALLAAMIIRGLPGEGAPGRSREARP